MKKLSVEISSLKEAAQHVEEPDHDTDALSETHIPAKLKPQNLGILYALEGFLINLNSKMGTKYLQTQIELELLDDNVEEEISRKKAILRDTIIMLLSSRSYEMLRKPAGMKKLRKDLLRSLNNVLNSGKIKEIYFTRFHFN